ncbi:MAG: hypothetical protein N2444_08515 [Methylocystis sp.]|nr:hypothetical protein [Methylocystis sp.]
MNGVPPGGRPWPISSFRATIRTNGSIEAKGEGLVLGGGGAIGTRGGRRASRGNVVLRSRESAAGVQFAAGAAFS